MTFSVTVLGSNSAIPTLMRNPSAHLLTAANERLFLIDCAEGTQLQLRRFHVHFQRIRHVFITHLHGDHFYGLIGLITSFPRLGRKNELHIHAHPQLQAIIRVQLEASQTSLIYPVYFHDLQETGYHMVYEDEWIEAHSFPLLHSIPTCGFMFREKVKFRKEREKRSYAYCSDTAYTEEIIPWIEGASLLYHETTFLHNMARAAHEKFHSTALEAARLAARAGVQRLMIGHFSARYDDLSPLLEEARSVFPETILAEEGIPVKI